MKGSFITIGLLLLITVNDCFSQTFHQDYWDGLLYIKVKAGKPLPPTGNFNTQAARLPSNSLTQDWLHLIQQYGIEKIERASILEDDNLRRYYKISFSKITETGNLLNQLKKWQDFEVVELRPIDRPTGGTPPNDFKAGVGWHLNRINALPAWHYTQGKQDIVIAIVDDAVKITHEDLAANIYINTKEIPNNGIDDDLNGFVDDVNGYDLANRDPDPNPPANATNGFFSHGTHCAGIAAGVTDNGKGIASVSYNCKIMPIKCTPDAATKIYIEKSVEGVEYAIKNKANIISMSFGSNSSFAYFADLMIAAFSRNIVCVAAAGNDNSNNSFYPACYDYVVTVGATDSYDQKAGYSNFGPWIDVMAPGNLYSTVAGSNSSYNYMGGTSMACPLVAGLCGLMLSYYPDKNPTDILNCLVASADNIDLVNHETLEGQLGGGRINAQRALECIEPPTCQRTALQSHWNSSFIYLAQNNDGYIAGSNAQDLTEIAQRFDTQRGVNLLSEVRIKFGKMDVQDPDSKIWLTVHELLYENGGILPSGAIHQIELPIQDIQAALSKSKDFIYTFNKPLDIPARFAVGLKFQARNGDKMGVYIAQSNAQMVWARKPGESWQVIKEIANKDFSLMLAPVVQHSIGNLNDTIKIQQLSNQTVRFISAEPNAGFYIWQFSNGKKGYSRMVDVTFDELGVHTATLSLSNDFCTIQKEVSFELKPIGIDPTLKQSPYILYPNPTNNLVYIAAQDTYPGAVYLYNSTGKLLLQNTTTYLDKFALDLTHYPTGFYYVKIKDESNNFHTFKVIRQ